MNLSPLGNFACKLLVYRSLGWGFDGDGFPQWGEIGASWGGPFWMFSEGCGARENESPASSRNKRKYRLRMNVWQVLAEFRLEEDAALWVNRCGRRHTVSLAHGSDVHTPLFIIDPCHCLQPKPDQL